MVWAMNFMARQLKQSIPQSQGIEPIRVAFQAQSLKRFSFGFENALADWMWIRLAYSAEHTPISSNQLSWEYAQAETITTLDPKFQWAYHFGSIYLSVFRQDKLGAKYLLQKWVKQEPTNWRAHYFLGFHLYSELNEYEGAAQEILLAARLPGAPSYLPALGIRLLSQTGALFHSLKMAVEFLIYAGTDIERKDRLIRRIRSLRFALQQAIWNESLELYRQQKSKEPDSISVLEEFAKPKLKQLARISDERVLSQDIQEILGEAFSFQYDTPSKRVISSVPEKMLDIDKPGIHRKEP